MKSQQAHGYPSCVTIVSLRLLLLFFIASFTEQKANSFLSDCGLAKYDEKQPLERLI